MFKKIISGAVCIIVFALILFNIKWGLSKTDALANNLIQYGYRMIITL